MMMMTVSIGMDGHEIFRCQKTKLKKLKFPQKEHTQTLPHVQYTPKSSSCVAHSPSIHGKDPIIPKIRRNELLILTQTIIVKCSRGKGERLHLID